MSVFHFHSEKFLPVSADGCDGKRITTLTYSTEYGRSAFDAADTREGNWIFVGIIT